MQFAAGMQRHRGVPGVQLAGGIDGQHILLQVAGIELQPGTERGAGLHQRGIVFQTGQRGTAMGQPAAEMALAGAPVQPVAGRLLEIQGPFPFTATGILSSLLDPLAKAGIGILATSTFDTDYVLVQDSQLQAAVTALAGAGHSIRQA